MHRTWKNSEPDEPVVAVGDCDATYWQSLGISYQLHLGYSGHVRSINQLDQVGVFHEWGLEWVAVFHLLGSCFRNTRESDLISYLLAVHTSQPFI
jgi:hypothetical protein